MPTFHTRQSCAAVDSVMVGKCARSTIGIDVVSQRRPAAGDGMFEDSASVSGKAFELSRVERIGRAGWMESRDEENLIDVDIAETCNYMLIEQCRFELTTGCRETVAKSSWRYAQAIGAEFRPAIFAQSIKRIEQPQPAEPSRIAEDHAAMLELPGDVDVIAFWEASVGRDKLHLTAHAEVNADCTAALANDSELFAVPMEGGDSVVLQERWPRNSLASCCSWVVSKSHKITTMNNDAENTLPRQMG